MRVQVSSSFDSLYDSQCVSRRESLNCKLEGECVDMEDQFLCDNGLCQNVSRVMDCQYTQVSNMYTCTHVHQGEKHEVCRAHYPTQGGGDI